MTKVEERSRYLWGDPGDYTAEDLEKVRKVLGLEKVEVVVTKGARPYNTHGVLYIHKTPLDYLPHAHIRHYLEPEGSKYLGDGTVARSVVVYGPAGSGKTFNSKAIARKLGLERVVEWGDMQQRGRGIGKFGLLYLCQEIPTELSHFSCYSITEFTSHNGKFYLGSELIKEPAEYESATERKPLPGSTVATPTPLPWEEEKAASIHLDFEPEGFPGRLLVYSPSGIASEYLLAKKPKPKFEIIGITGKKRSGKDTLANEFVNLGYDLLSFAAPMKKMLQVILGHIQDDKKEEILPEFGVSYRHMAQTLGTEWGRNLISPDLWVKLLERQLRPGGKYVISDVRFNNEANFIRKFGGLLIHVERETGRVDTHSSESGVTWVMKDTLINNHYSSYEEYKLFCARYAKSLSKDRSQT